MKPILIIAATTRDRRGFRRHARLGRSLARLSNDPLIESAIAYLNLDGLPKVFNRQICETNKDYILAFTHDDASLEDCDLALRLNEAVRAFDIVGVAGNKRRRPLQPAWAFPDDSLVWDDPANLSGEVSHIAPSGRQVSRYGTTPEECKLLDGVFLAAAASTLLGSGVGFDERFKFHFYDMDFCRSAELASLRMGTWPITLTHQSGGSFGSPGWAEQLRLYRDKWGERRLS
jgi:GT2 family glycosyltransferase